jgi:signal transduction histidine kinase
VNPANLTIGQKGWILITIPLVFEIVIASSLWLLFIQADHKAVQLSYSRDIILNLGNLSALLLEAGGSMLTYAYTSKPSLVAASRHSEEECTKALNNLLRVANLAGRDAGEYSQLKNTITGAIRSLQKYESSDQSVGMLSRVNSLRKELQVVHQNLKIIIDHLSEIEKQIERKETEADKQLKSKIQFLLIFFIAASVVLSALLARFFFSNIALRISKIEENSRRVGFRDELPPALTGDDELARLDRTLHQAANDLAASERKKQMMVAMISHDLRSPLLSLQGTLALLLAGACGVMPEKAQTRLEKAEKSLERLIAMITDFLDLEKFSASDAVISLNLTDTKFQKLFDETMLSVEMLAEESSVKIICSGGEVTFAIDMNLMVRLFSNLLSNAIKFSPHNSTIEVHAQNDSSGVFITVTDHGCGIDSNSLDFLFEPFFQTREGSRQENSSGLGLAVCREIARRHKGEITVRSKVGVGTEFRVSIPNLGATVESKIS